MKFFPMTHYEFAKKFVRGFQEYINHVKENFKNKDIGFKEFADWFTNDSNLDNFVKIYGLSNVNLLARQIFHAWRMEICKDKIYYMSREVCDLVTNTRLTIDAEFLESPFEQIYIYTDQSSVMISDHTGSQPVKGIYINLKRESDNIKYLRFVATTDISGINRELDINYYATFIIPEHGYLEDIADRQVQTFIEDKRVLNEIDLDILRKLFSFCVNSLLYLGCKNVEFINFIPPNIIEALNRKKSNKGKAKLERRLEKSGQIPFIIVNPKKSKIISSGVNGNGVKLDHQIMVSGHWRGQWYGSKDSENLQLRRKEIIRIQSYLKGIDLKEGEKKVYVVK